MLFHPLIRETFAALERNLILVSSTLYTRDGSESTSKGLISISRDLKPSNHFRIDASVIQAIGLDILSDVGMDRLGFRFISNCKELISLRI